MIRGCGLAASVAHHLLALMLDDNATPLGATPPLGRPGPRVQVERYRPYSYDLIDVNLGGIGEGLLGHVGVAELFLWNIL
jgi:hypothetical protein